MIEAKVTQEDGFHILTDNFKFPNEWAVEVYTCKQGNKRIQFNSDTECVNYPLSDVIEFLQELEEKK